MGIKVVLSSLFQEPYGDDHQVLPFFCFLLRLVQVTRRFCPHTVLTSTLTLLATCSGLYGQLVWPWEDSSLSVLREIAHQLFPQPSSQQKRE